MTSTESLTTTGGPEPQPSSTPPVRVGPVIALLVVSAFVVILNETIMSVAISDLSVELGVPVSTAQWLTTGFLLTMAIVIPLTGLLLQRLPVRTVFFLAMGLFTAGTLLAALAPGFGVLLVGRIVQASGTAIMLPLLFTTVLNVVPAERRGRMMGVISIVISVAPAIGPTVSGLILSVLEWRWMFGIVLPIAVLSMVLGAVWVKNVTETRPVRVDVVSVVLSALAFGGLIFGLSSIGEASGGHALVPPAIPVVVGAVALGLFVWRQIALRETDRVLMDLRVFRSRSFALAVLVVIVLMIALFGTIILTPIYLQQVLGLSVLQSGLVLLPGGALMGLLAPLVGSLFDRFGPRPLVLPGAVVASAGLWGMTTLGESASVPTVIGLHVVLSAGLAFMFTPLLTSALGSLPQQLYSHGSAIVSTLQQVAGAAGTAMFVTLMTVGTAAAAQEGAAQTTALAGGVHTAFLVGASISLLAVVLTFFVRRPPEGAEAPPEVAVH